MNKASFLGEDPVSSLLWKFSLPAVTGMLVGALYNVIDSIFVGRGVNELALTAVTVAFPIMTILMAVGMLVGVGAATLVSLYLGQKKQDLAEKILGNAVTMMIFFVFITTSLALYFLDPLLINVLGVTPEVLPYAHDFTSVILLGSVFFHVGFGLNNVIRAQGDPRTALATQVIAAIINGILNYIFIFHWNMGIKGSAFATICAQAFAAIWVMTYFIRGKGLLKLHMSDLKIKQKLMLSIMKLGLAPFSMQLGASAVMVVLNLQIQAYGGVLAVAAFGIVNRILMLVMMPVAGISQGSQPIMGYNYGAKQYDRVLETLSKAILISTLICLAGFAVVECFPGKIIAVFNEEPQLIALGSTGLQVFLCLMPIIGFQIIGANYFQAIGKAYYSILFNTLRQIIVLIPLVFLFSHLWGLTGIWAAGPVSDLASALVTAFCLRKDIKRLKSKIAKPAM
ncbi:MAG: MATE family efflux transporter [Sporomusaceae bacterium]|nr:MATE family efflux transporter [Sporomusaceae bacterium]